MNILFTVCGRAGSKGFKNKNLKLFNGIPLVYYTLAVIKQFKDKYNNDVIDVVINTDSLELINLVKEQKMITDIDYIVRNKTLAGDTTPKVDVIKNSFEEITLSKSKQYDYIIDLDITSPIRTLKDIENALSIMIKDDQCDVVFSVVKSRRNPYFNMVEESDGYYKKICNSNFTTRQATPAVFDLNASIYVYNNKFLSKKINKTLLEYQCKISEMSDYLILDIDSEEDFEMMSFLYPVFCRIDPALNKTNSLLIKEYKRQ